MNAPKKQNDGCLWMFLFGLLSLFGYIGVSTVTGLDTTISILIGMVIAGIFATKWVGKPSLKGLVGNALFIFGAIMLLRFFGSVFTQILENTAPPTFNKEEGIEKTVYIENNDTIDVYSSHRIWKDNFGNPYEGTLTVRDDDYRRLRNHIINFKETSSSNNFWGNLYRYLDKTDAPSLDLVMKSFEDINRQKNLNRMEFAEMVVSCIQDIPYSFIFQEQCMPAQNYEPSIREILEECPECCLGNVTYGIQNSVSFLQNLKGDCDTRTVLIYSILKHFNYDVAILNSDFYRHSIIGLNLPTSGIYKLHRGKKYVVWETTAKYFEAGKLPSNFNDITHWDIVLTSK